MLKLKALSKSMSKLNVRKEKVEIRLDMKICRLPSTNICNKCNIIQAKKILKMYFMKIVYSCFVLLI